MKRFLLLFVCSLMCVCGFSQKLTSESKEAVKKDVKMFEKAGWKGAGRDAKLKEAVERSYIYIQDTVHYVWAQAAASEIDAKNAIAIATQIAQKKALEKAKDVLHERGVKIKRIDGNAAISILTLYRDHKKKEDGSQAYVRVALKIAE